RGVAFHHAEIGGLEPGTTYFYQVFSDGVPGRYDRYHPGSFTSLRPPAAKPLFEFAILADIHIGEDVSGSPAVPTYRASPEDDYSTAMARAAVAEINGRGVDFTMLPADNSNHGSRHDLEDAKAILDGLERPYVIARGAHDRPKQYEEAVEECGADGDCFRAVFFPERPAGAQPQHIYYAYDTGRKSRYVVIALDSANLDTGTGELSDEQLAWLDRKLTETDRGNVPVFIFFHHPVSEWSTTLAVPPLVFGVNQQDAQEFLQIVGRHDSVRTIVNSHTHRNWISYSPWTGRVPILEVGPSKEYPGGYSIIRAYRDGFTRTFHRLRCEFCRRWIETTRWEYAGNYPHYTTGSLRDRNFVHRWDRPDVPAGPPSLPFNPWPPFVPMEA
ncbi:MAG TPA: metallophosphoesterase family protein, partial [Actinomycetota bacterium]|nr:metallophosphoesterase family protein [Actinomycetota bacterium]